MILYHGSYMVVDKPCISLSRQKLDFGRGFYTTPIKEQATSWAERFLRQRRSGIVSSYEFDQNSMSLIDSVLVFDSYSEEWLDFIVACRRGETVGPYSVVVGGVADDRVFDTIQLFFDGLIDKSSAIKRLRYNKPNVQYCFRRQDVIDKYLKYVSSEVL